MLIFEKKVGKLERCESLMRMAMSGLTFFFYPDMLNTLSIMGSLNEDFYI